MKRFITRKNIIWLGIISLAATALPPSNQEKQFLPSNHIYNPGFEKNTSGWQECNASGAAPTTDVSVGTSNLVVATNTTSPLEGSVDLKISKPASNEQGKCVFTEFQIPKGHEYKPITLEFLYRTTMTTGADSDVKVFIANKTTSQVTQPYVNYLDGSGKYQGQWQAGAETTYQLILWTTTTNASAWDLFVDAFRSRLAGELSIRSANPTFSAFISATGVITQESADWLSSCTNATTPVCTFTTGFFNGTPNCWAAGGIVGVTTTTSTTTTTTMTNGSSGTAQSGARWYFCQDSTANPDIKTAGQLMQKYPVEVSAYKNGGAVSGNTDIGSWTAEYDPTNSFNTTSGVFTAPYVCVYEGEFLYNATAASFTQNVIANGVSIAKNATDNTRGVVSFKTFGPLAAGQTISFQVNTAKTTASTDDTRVNIRCAADSSAFLVIPRTQTCTATVSDSDVVSKEMCRFGTTHDWINGNCTNATAGRQTCTINSGIFIGAPTCHCTVVNGVANQRICQMWGAETSTTVITNVSSGSGTDSNNITNLTCEGILIQ